MKKIISFILSYAIFLGIFSFTPALEKRVSADTGGIYTYTVTDGEATITDCDENASGEIIIPDTLGGYPVTAIGEEAFAGISGITSVIIPYGVTSINNWGFACCINLSSITIPSGVQSIGQGAFTSCHGLTSIIIPDGVTSIGDEVFSLCINLNEVNLPDSITRIGDSAFKDCFNLTTINIPKNITVIEGLTFFDCGNLTSIVIPDGVTSIKGDAFGGCTGLTSLTIPESVTNIECSFESIDLIIYGVEGSYAEEYANENYIPFNYPYVFFYEIDNNEAIITYCAKDTSGDIVIPSTLRGCPVTAIGNEAFEDCTELTSVTIPYGVKTIGDGAFFNCTALSSISLPNSLTSIAESAFLGSGLTSVTIPDSVTSIGTFAFGCCYNLSSVTIPESVTKIEHHAFADTPWIDNYEGDFVIIGEQILYVYKGNGQTVSIPNGVKSINDYAFNYIDGNQVIAVAIPNSVTEINNYAFCDVIPFIYGNKGSCAEEFAKEHDTMFLEYDFNYDYAINLPNGIEQGDGLVLNIILSCFNPQKEPAVLGIALYDSNDLLVSFKNEIISFEDHQWIMDGKYIEPLFNCNNEYKIKVFLWNDLNQMIPLAEPAEDSIQIDI